MGRILAAVTAFTVLLGGLTACGASSSSAKSSGTSSEASADSKARNLLPKDIRDKGEITAGATAQFPPFAYLPAGGKTLVGYEPDIVNEIAKRLDLKVNWSTFDFQGLIPAIQSGRIQVAAAGLTDTSEREDTAIFVNDLIGRNGAIVPKGDKNKYKKFNDLCGKTVAAVTGSVGVTIVTKQNDSCKADGLKPMTILELPDNSATLLAVTSGRAAAAMQTWPGAGYQAQQNSDLAAIVINEGMNARFTNGLAIDKKSPGLADAFAAALQDMVNDGTYAKIMKANGVDLKTNGITKVYKNWTTNGFK
jgi:polar amino acid transport system substrate-binding protein